MSWVISTIIGLFTVTALEYDGGHYNLLLTNCRPNRGCNAQSIKLSAYLDDNKNLKEGDVVYIKSTASCQKIQELENDKYPRIAYICNAETLEIIR